ncbi:hypothetical protein A3K79_01510 [Candidatus Bathyarchaeota archaeon RBG_13_46_16b]|nr:MAG: hypothetical protein A3K79_01510 [Candidatus Bathyarchaeota archaeon RBG_13_46_16b]
MTLTRVRGTGQKTLEHQEKLGTAEFKARKKQVVVFVTPQILSTDHGGGIRVFEEARALSLHGSHTISMYTYGFGESSEDLLPSSTSASRIWFTPKAFSAGPTAHRIHMDAQLALKSIASLRCKPDIVHVHAHEGVPIARFLSLLDGCPLVFDIQGSTVDEIVRGGLVKNGGFTYQLLWRLEQLISKMATILISSSPTISEMLIDQFGIEKQKVVTVLDAVDTNIFKPLGKEAEPIKDLRKKLSILENRRIAVYVGSFSKLQGTDILIRSIPHVLKSNPDVTFLLVGGKWNARYYESMKKLAQKLNIRKHVVFIPSADYYRELPIYLSLADVALAPKMHSPQSHGKLPVYMAFGLPTVVFDIPINKLFLDGLGIFVNKISPASLAEGIESALDEYADNPEFRLKLRARATTLFSLKRLATDLENAYRIAHSAA